MYLYVKTHHTIHFIYVQFMVHHTSIKVERRGKEGTEKGRKNESSKVRDAQAASPGQELRIYWSLQRETGVSRAESQCKGADVTRVLWYQVKTEGNISGWARWVSLTVATTWCFLLADFLMPGRFLMPRHLKAIQAMQLTGYHIQVPYREWLSWEIISSSHWQY